MAIPRCKIYLDIRFPKQRDGKGTGEYPVKIEITFGGKQRFYATGRHLSPEDYDKMIRNDRGFGNLNKKIQAELAKWQHLVESINDFSWDAFDEARGSKKQKHDVYSLFQERIDKYTKRGQYGTAETYSSALKSIKAFHPATFLPFSAVNETFLESFENWLVEEGSIKARKKEKIKGVSLGTVGMYMRSLHHVVTTAIGKRLANYDPFGKGKYITPSKVQQKYPLTRDEVRAIRNHPLPEMTTPDKMRDFWCMSYMMNGANLRDIADLRWNQIINTPEGKELTFIRAKTRNASATVREITVIVVDELDRLIQKWGSLPANADGLVFDIIKEGDGQTTQRTKVKNMNKLMGKHLKSICKELGIENRKINPKAARVAFVNALWRGGTPIDKIQHIVGHGQQRTTEIYIGSLDRKSRKEAAESIL